MGDASRVSEASPLRRLHYAPKTHLTLTLGVGGVPVHIWFVLCMSFFSAEIFPLSLLYCCCTCAGVECFAHTLYCCLSWSYPWRDCSPSSKLAHYPGEVLHHLSNSCCLRLTLGLRGSLRSPPLQPLSRSPS